MAHAPGGSIIGKRGLTLFEAILSLAIIGLLAALIIPSLASFRDRKTLDATVEDILSFLGDARMQTLASRNDGYYGVHFETARAVLFQGPTFTEPNANNRELTIHASLEISPIALAGGVSNVLFDRITGKTSQSGTVTVRLKRDTSIMRTITIESTGVAHGN